VAQDMFTQYGSWAQAALNAWRDRTGLGALMGGFGAVAACYHGPPRVATRLRHVQPFRWSYRESVYAERFRPAAFAVGSIPISSCV